jgi:hypothetical protein
MAVNISIPGIGTVQAANAATEATLQQLLGVMSGQTQKQRRADSEIAQASRAQASNADRAADSMGQMANNSKSAETAARQYFNSLQDSIQRVTLVAGDVKDSGLGTYFKQLGATAVDVAATWAKSFREIRNEPLKRSGDLLSTQIDIVGRGFGALMKSIPGVPEGLTETVISGAIAALKIGNKAMNDELVHSVEALQIFNKMGASFGGGIAELRVISNNAGVTIDQFSHAMKKSEPYIHNMGVSVSGATKMVSRNMEELGATAGNSGASLRNELRALGYTIDDQIELSAQYLSNLKATMTAEQFRKLDAEKVARGTRQYAEDLKVLADITGKNAKQAMEEARAKSMEADIMAQLSPEEAEKFREAYAAMPDYAKKGFLEYVSSGGTAITDAATNIAMSQNNKLEGLIKGTFSNIKNSALSASQVQDSVLKGTSEVRQEQERQLKQGGAAINIASRLGATGLDQISSIFNAMIANGQYLPDAVEKSRKAAENQAKMINQLDKDVIAIQNSTQKFATALEQNITPYMGAYAESLKKANQFTNALTVLGVKGLTGKSIDREGKETPVDITDFFSGLTTLLRTELGNIAKVIADKLRETEQQQARALGGPVNPNRQYIVGEKGPELFVPHTAGTILPNANSTMKELPSIQNLQTTFANVIEQVNRSKQTVVAEPKKEEIKELPTALSTALETVISSPTGLKQVMQEVKMQIADDNKMQNSMMQQQIDNLTKLVDAMNENVRYSERIANELG